MSIRFYIISSQETFGSYLFGALGLIAPAIILIVYILLTLPMKKHSIVDSYKEYIAMILMLVGFVINYITLVNGCHRGKIPKFDFKKLKQAELLDLQ